MNGTCDCCEEQTEVDMYVDEEADEAVTLCADCVEVLRSVSYAEGDDGLPDDEAFVDRPALGRTHNYGNRAV